jgi:glycine cleavage system H protein
VFVADGHAWARIEPSGQVRVGLDDFARKALGAVEKVALPSPGTEVKRGDPLFTVSRGSGTAHFPAPVTGKVTEANAALATEPDRVSRSPYDRGWVCLVQPADLAAELPTLRIGRPVVDWYQQEIERLRTEGGAADRGTPLIDWPTLEEKFFAPAPLIRA